MSGDWFPKSSNKVITVRDALKKVSLIGFYPEITNNFIKQIIFKIKPNEAASKYHPNCSYFNVKRMPLDKPSYTITKTFSGFIHPTENRYISINEAKELCSFPYNWKLGNNFNKAWARLGNSVMPKMMQAIAEHIKENIITKQQPTVISLFAGTGGSSLGYKWAGYKELLAIDWEDHAVKCFKLNFPEVPCWHKDITKVTVEDVLTFCKINKGDLDVLDGSPPCQGFSTAGKREVSDSRNDLFKHYWRIVTGLQPKVFVMENVSGMIKGTMKGKFKEIMTTLKSDNYEVKCKLMNAMYYGVPQSRERLIFIGVRKDILKQNMIY